MRILEFAALALIALAGAALLPSCAFWGRAPSAAAALVCDAGPE